MITVLCVLRTGGIYDAGWVRKLRDGVARNLTVPHRFVCLSDTEVPCERIPLEHDWPGWWAKIELFRPGVITGPTLYLDLDTVITGSLDELVNLPDSFAMLRNFHQPDMVGSGVMWFRDVPHKVYRKFSKMPQCYIDHHERVAKGSYLGDQAFIADTVGLENIGKISMPSVRSYKYHCKSFLPEEASVVCFHGLPRPTEVKAPWMERHWS